MRFIVCGHPSRPPPLRTPLCPAGHLPTRGEIGCHYDRRQSPKLQKGCKRRGRLISPLEGEMSGRTEGGAKGHRAIRIYHYTCLIFATPGFSTVWPLKVGKDGRPQARSSSKLRATLRPSVRRFLFPPVPLLPEPHPEPAEGGSHSDQVQCSSRGLCAFYRHAGVIVPPGEPPGGTSPAMMPRQHHSGGAGSSPRNHRHDRCSRWEELTGIMEEGRKAWIKGEKKNAESAKIGGFRRLTGAILSTFGGRPTTSSSPTLSASFSSRGREWRRFH